MGRTRRFLHGVMVHYLNQIIVALVSLWLTPFLLKTLGTEIYGLWLVGSGILTYLLLLDFGVLALLPRETAFALGRAGSPDQIKDLPDVIGQTIRIVLLQMPIIFIAAVSVWMFLPADWEPIKECLGIIFIVFVFTYPIKVFQNVLQGLQDLGFLGILNTTSWLLGTGVSIALVLSGFGINSLAIGWTITQVLLLFGAWLRFRSKFRSIYGVHFVKLSWHETKSRLRKSLWTSVSQISVVLLNGTEVILIGKMLGPAAVVLYVCSTKLIAMLSHQSLIITQAAGPALSELRAAESHEKLLSASTAMNQLLWTISGLIFCVVLAINEGFVHLWVGGKFFGGTQFTLLVLITMFLRHWNTGIIYNVFCFGHEKALALTGVTDGVVTVTAMALLLPMLGVIAIPIGGMLGVTVISLPVMLSVLSKELKVSVLTLMRAIAPWLIQLFVMACLLLLIHKVWVPNTVFSLIAFAIVTAGVFLLIAAPFLYRSTLGGYLRPRLDHLKSKLRIALKTT